MIIAEIKPDSTWKLLASHLGPPPVYVHKAYLFSTLNYVYYHSKYKVPSQYVRNYLTHKIGVEDIKSVYSDIYYSANNCRLYDDYRGFGD